MQINHLPYILIILVIIIFLFTEHRRKNKYINNIRNFQKFLLLKDNGRTAALTINHKTGDLNCVFHKKLATGDEGVLPFDPYKLNDSDDVIVVCHSEKMMNLQEYRSRLITLEERKFDPHAR